MEPVLALLPTNDSQLPLFQPIALGPELLQLALQSQLQLRTAATAPQPAKTTDRGPAAIPPWEVDQDPKSLARRINDVRNLDQFIDLGSDDVKRAGDDVDSRTLFALFNGLAALETLAQYAAEESTISASLGRLNTQFQAGLAEIQDFVSSASLDRLDLIFGEKSSNATSAMTLGSDTASYAGQVIQTGGIDDPLEGIDGSESFIVRITEDGETVDIAVDLSEITGDITIGAVVDLLNEKIEAETIDDGNGNFVGRFQSRFEVNTTKTYDYRIRLAGSKGEVVSLIPQNADPALVVAGTRARIGADVDPVAGQITTLGDLDTSDPTRKTPILIQGQDSTGAAAATQAEAVAVDSEGAIYVVGTSAGGFAGQLNDTGSDDVFLTKLDSNGKVVYSRLLGGAVSPEGLSITIDGEDNVIIAGATDGHLESGDLLGGTDSFVTKFSTTGEELFTTQFDNAATDRAFAVTTDANGDIFLVGEASGVIASGQNFGGGSDALVTKLSGADGIIDQSVLIGGSGFESARGVAVAADGNLLIASEENGKAVLRKLDVSDLSQTLYSLEVGDLDGGEITGLAVDGSAVFLSGFTKNGGFGSGVAPPVNAASDGTDGFLVRIDDAGASATGSFTTFIGTNDTDRARALAVSGGEVYVAGDTTGGLVGGGTVGSRDSFVAKVDATTGDIGFVEQFGTPLNTSSATGIAFSTNVDSVIDKLGLHAGALNAPQTRDIVSQTSVRDGDHFYISIDGGAKQRIEIEAGDTFETLARKIQLLSIQKIEAESKFTLLGPQLSIKAVNGAEIEFFAGSEGRDALAKLGIPAGRLLSFDRLFNLDSTDSDGEPADKPGVFGLNLSSALNLADKSAAKFALTQIQAAMETVKRAFRSLSRDEVINSFLNGNAAAAQAGPPPPYLQAQIQNFQAALVRLQAASLTSSSGFLV